MKKSLHEEYLPIASASSKLFGNFLSLVSGNIKLSKPLINERTPKIVKQVDTYISCIIFISILLL